MVKIAPVLEASQQDCSHDATSSQDNEAYRSFDKVDHREKRWKGRLIDSRADFASARVAKALVES